MAGSHDRCCGRWGWRFRLRKWLQRPEAQALSVPGLHEGIHSQVRVFTEGLWQWVCEGPLGLRCELVAAGVGVCLMEVDPPLSVQQVGRRADVEALMGWQTSPDTLV